MHPNLEVPRTPWALSDELLTEYYDTEWGLPITDERGVFERLTLEVFQSGLSWLTILKRRDGFRDAFEGFDVETLAEFEDADVARLLSDARIIRNRRKIEATIINARATVGLRDTIEGGLPALVWSCMPAASPVCTRDDTIPSTSRESVELANALKREGFHMVGPTNMFALMSAIGIVDLHTVDSFRRGCSGLWNTDGTRSAQMAPFSASR